MEDKTTLAQKDIRFARTIQRLQRVVLAEIEKIAIVHLFSLGYRNEDLLSFKLTLNNPSKIAELQELEHLRTKFDIAGAATDGYFSKRWVYKNIFKIDDDEIQRIMWEQYTDSKHSSVLEAAGTAAGEAITGGAGGEDLGAEDLGGEDLGGEDLGDEEVEDEGPLLAEPDPEEAPGSRDDDWYNPVKTDSRKAGARKRSYLASAGESLGSNSSRNLFKGWSSELGPLSRGVVGEGIDREEALLDETSRDIKMLITQLEERHEKQT
jgi:hypothetical protein